MVTPTVIAREHHPISRSLIDPDALKRRLTVSAERVLGPNIVTNIVFLRSFTRKVS